MRLVLVLKIPSAEDCGYFVQQPLTPADVEQNATKTAWSGLVLSHNLGALSFAGTMLSVALQTLLFA